MLLRRYLAGLCIAPALHRTASSMPMPASASAAASELVPAQTLQESIDTDGFSVRTYGWHDAQGEPRTAALVRSGLDPKGFYGGYLRSFSYIADGLTRMFSSSSDDDPGFGFTVHHFPKDGGFPSTSSRFYPATSDTTYFNGRHHKIQEYTYEFNINDQPLITTLQWLFVTGQNHPLWAVTYDTSKAAPNSITADTRGPYGDLNYDGGEGADVAGIGWGDRYKLKTFAIDGTYTLNSGWSYNEPNTVPYVQSYTLNPDAEMGMVATQTYLQHDQGGYGGYVFWGQSVPNGPMIPPAMQAYQTNGWSFPYTNTSKRIAWGSNYGAVGQNPYLSYGNDRNLSGTPYQSYSVQIVFGLHRTDPVAQQVQQVENLQSAHLTAINNVRVLDAAPAGLARPDSSSSGGPRGYNPIYGTWDVHAVANTSSLSWSLAVGEGALAQCTFVVHNWPSLAPPVAVYNGAQPLLADSLQGYLASVDVARQTLWLTVGGPTSASGPLVLSVAANLSAQAPENATPSAAPKHSNANAALAIQARSGLLLAAAAAACFIA